MREGERFEVVLKGAPVVGRVLASALEREEALARLAELFGTDSSPGVLDVLSYATSLEDMERQLVARDVVAGELTKQLGWSRSRPVLHHLRTHAAGSGLELSRAAQKAPARSRRSSPSSRAGAPLSDAPPRPKRDRRTLRSRHRQCQTSM